MYDPKFEKAVQQRMEELEFRPSDSVWVHIEAAVSEKRRRRGIPLFWRLTAAVVLLAAIGGAYYFGREAGKKVGATAVAGRPAGRTTIGEKTSGSAANAGKTVGASAAAGKVAVTKQSAGGAKGLAAAKRAHSGTVIVHEAIVVHAVIMPKAYLYTPGLEGHRFAQGVQGAALKTNRGLVSLSTLSRVKRPWEAGFVAGGGFDRFERLNDGQAVNAVSYMSASLYGLSRAAMSKNAVSAMQPGASFYAGIYLQKAVSERWTFHTGLDLHYYSTGISVGQPMNIIASPSASLLNQRAPAASSSAPVVYTVGTQQTYTNRYYMLELPVAIQYQLNRSKLLPLFLEGGASVSRLMGANAIFYNPLTGYYLKNEDALNKTLFNVSSALVVGLPFHGIRIQAGPEVQYGLTPLINGQGLGDQHLLYAGLRLVVLPGRK